MNSMYQMDSFLLIKTRSLCSQHHQDTKICKTLSNTYEQSIDECKKQLFADSLHKSKSCLTTTDTFQQYDQCNNQFVQQAFNQFQTCVNANDLKYFTAVKQSILQSTTHPTI
jgi:hypothetical protein